MHRLADSRLVLTLIANDAEKEQATMPEQDRSQTGSTRKRWLLWGGLTLSLLVIAGGVLVWLTQAGPMERAYNQLRLEMTLKEVEGIFTGPYTEQPIGERVFFRKCKGDDGTVILLFIDDVLRDTVFSLPEDPSRLQRYRYVLRSLLGWREPEPRGELLR
jgi:hypothetical protein